MEQDIATLMRQQDLKAYHETPEEEFLRKGTYGEAPKLIVQFYIGAEKDVEATHKEGAPVYREKICVLVRVPGDKDSMTQDVTDEHIQKYPNEWQLFLKLSKRGPQIPLAALPKMRPHILKAFEELHIHSVNDLAEKEVPGYLNQWKPWAMKILSVHEFADKPKPRLKFVEGELVAA
jgi:hypothetical protein